METTPQRPGRNTKAFLCLLGGGCGIAFAPIFVRLSDTGPVASAGWRVLLASPLLWAWTLRRGATAQAVRPTMGMLLAGVFFAADLGVWHWSIALTSVANATLLANLAPIVVTLGERVLFGQRVTRQFLAGMLLALAGMFVLVAPNIATSRARLAGDALGALTAVFYGSYLLSIKASRNAGIPTAPLMAWSTTVSAIVLLPMAMLFPQRVVPQGPHGWLVLACLAFVTQVVGQGLIAYALAHLPTSLSSVSLLIQPVLAAHFAWALLGEPIGPPQLIGGAIVLAGIAVAKRASDLALARPAQNT